ncbi:hypothetical protein A6R68_21953 [Neotoma lepida]|uniref:Small ribosomal subunit protein eS6 n=1 Tax=Neotoma lepida TaxID=56216 RepID=A0A1A6HNM3_NEOLE|nr:hypothetical protein A6R68_21953 [Neotoma lepida]
MKLNIFSATGYQKFILVDNKFKLHTFFEKLMITEVAADALGEEWKFYVEKPLAGIYRKKNTGNKIRSSVKSDEQKIKDARRVVAKQALKKLLTRKQAPRKKSQGCYMYYFQYLSKTYCVDATRETNRLRRLINHSKCGNCQTKLHDIDGMPHLIFIASRDIAAEEELLYDYGDRSKASIEAYPWLKH